MKLRYIFRNTKFSAKSQQKKSSTISIQSFSDEILNDQIKSALYINRATEALEQLGEGHFIAQHEQYAVDVYKRALLLIGCGNVKILDNDGNFINGSENNLLVSSYLSHGSRVMIEEPLGSNNALANWLSSGNPDKDNFSLKKNQVQAIQEGKYIYTRYISTHKIDRQLHGDFQHILIEKQGFFIGLKELFLSVMGKHKHFGLELALDAKFAEQNSKGDYVKYPDGEHGHLYIYYSKSTETKVVGMLIGIENANPMSTQHSKLGRPNKFSPIGSTKFNTLVIKKQIENNPLYEKTIIHKVVGGMKITLSKKELSKIVQLDDKDYGVELAYAKPGVSVEDFQNSILQALNDLDLLGNKELSVNFSTAQNIMENDQNVIELTGDLNNDNIDLI